MNRNNLVVAKSLHVAIPPERKPALSSRFCESSFGPGFLLNGLLGKTVLTNSLLVTNFKSVHYVISDSGTVDGIQRKRVCGSPGLALAAGGKGGPSILFSLFLVVLRKTEEDRSAQLLDYHFEVFSFPARRTTVLYRTCFKPSQAPGSEKGGTRIALSWKTVDAFHVMPVSSRDAPNVLCLPETDQETEQYELRVVHTACSRPQMTSLA